MSDGRPTPRDAAAWPDDRPPRDAATLVLVDRSDGAPRILMGRRRSTQVFLPDKFVFPGGRADAEDRAAPRVGALRPGCMSRLAVAVDPSLMAGAAEALALAAVRETFEETGHVLGRRDTGGKLSDHAAGAGWAAFLAHGMKPDLSALTFFARAITPPGRPRRYDTRFFLADARAVAATAPPPDDELREIGWFTVTELRSMDLPNITRLVVEDLVHHDSLPPAARLDWHPPFYRYAETAFQRRLIAPDGLV
ncbi:MAG: NUDIX hydrolase [Hyphomicrobiaceae bacterium]|nr:NUDIX hydrolase [Hyphomicrobiaceae bacterium]